MIYYYNCAEDYSKRSMTVSAELDMKDWAATRVWTIHSNNQNWSSGQITPLPGNDPLPTLGQPHPQNAYLSCSRAVTRQTENPTFWEMTVEYKVLQNVEVQPDPLTRPPRFRFLVGEESVPWFFDKDGNPIVNSAGDFFDPQPQDVRATLSIRITRFESTYDANKALNYMNSTNSDVWVLPNKQTLQPGQARMHTIEQGSDTDKNSRFVEVTYVAYLTDSDFSLIAVDQGFQAWDYPNTSNKQLIKEKIFNKAATGLSTSTISSPALLNGRGTAIVPSNYQLGPTNGVAGNNPNPLTYITRVTSTAGVVGLKYKQLKLRSFNALALV